MLRSMTYLKLIFVSGVKLQLRFLRQPTACPHQCGDPIVSATTDEDVFFSFELLCYLCQKSTGHINVGPLLNSVLFL